MAAEASRLEKSCRRSVLVTASGAFIQKNVRGGGKMSKYDALWQYVRDSGEPNLTLSFDEIGQFAGVPLDHDFLGNL